MTLDEFRHSLADPAPPPGLFAPLEALLRAANDEWDGAHALAQSARDPAGAWVHAHLAPHRGRPPQRRRLVPPRRQTRLRIPARRGVGGDRGGDSAHCPVTFI